MAGEEEEDEEEEEKEEEEGEEVWSTCTSLLFCSAER